MATCGSPTKSGGLCAQRAGVNGRCWIHGGRNTGQHLIKHGKYSKFLPRRLAARYEEALKDEQLLDLSHELALLETRLCELLGNLDTIAGPESWLRAAELWTKAKAGNGLQSLSRDELGEFDAALSAGPAGTEKWSEILELIERRRRLAETEGKRLAQMQQFITAQQANVLVAALIHAINTHVSDPRERSKVGAELVRLTGIPDRGGDRAE